MTTKPLIFEYDDYRKYLKDLHAHLKETNRAYSFRFFARQAGFTSPNFLKLVIDGQRNLTSDSVQKFAGALKLNKQESEFFENLVFFNQALDTQTKNQHFEKMAKNRRYREIRHLENDQFEFYSQWYYSAIRELVTLDGFVEDVDWIARKLVPKITHLQAKKAIALLLGLKLLERDANGKLRQTSQTISSGAEVKSLAVKNFHQQMLKMATESIDRVPAPERDISSVTIGIPESKFSELKERLSQFRKELLASIGSAPGSLDRVYQLNIQVFPLSKGKKERG